MVLSFCHTVFILSLFFISLSLHSLSLGLFSLFDPCLIFFIFLLAFSSLILVLILYFLFVLFNPDIFLSCFFPDPLLSFYVSPTHSSLFDVRKFLKHSIAIMKFARNFLLTVYINHYKITFRLINQKLPDIRTGLWSFIIPVAFFTFFIV